VVFISAVAALMGTAACSHQQKPDAPRPPAAQAPAAPARKPVAVVAARTDDGADTSKAKESPAIYFDFDSALLKDDGRRVLQGVADTVRKRNAALEIDGNCDELGTVEYNLALGEHRARAAKEYLVHLGVPPTKIDTVSFGSQRPKYEGHDDEARAKNRRDDLVVR